MLRTLLLLLALPCLAILLWETVGDPLTEADGGGGGLAARTQAGPTW
jgi:hypothetical protein